MMILQLLTDQLPTANTRLTVPAQVITDRLLGHQNIITRILPARRHMEHHRVPCTRTRVEAFEVVLEEEVSEGAPSLVVEVYEDRTPRMVHGHRAILMLLQSINIHKKSQAAGGRLEQRAVYGRMTCDDRTRWTLIMTTGQARCKQTE